MRRAGRVVAALGLAAGLASCSNPSTASSTTSTTANRTTDTFNGTVQVKGSDMHTFTVQNSGQVDVTLTTTTPAATLGIAVGTPSGSACPAIPGSSASAVAGATAQVSGILSPASYCVVLFDAGSLAQAVSYTVTVVHP